MDTSRQGTPRLSFLDTLGSPNAHPNDPQHQQSPLGPPLAVSSQYSSHLHPKPGIHFENKGN